MVCSNIFDLQFMRSFLKIVKTYIKGIERNHACSGKGLFWAKITKSQFLKPVQNFVPRPVRLAKTFICSKKPKNIKIKPFFFSRHENESYFYCCSFISKFAKLYLVYSPKLHIELLKFNLTCGISFLQRILKVHTSHLIIQNAFSQPFPFRLSCGNIRGIIAECSWRKQRQHKAAERKSKRVSSQAPPGNEENMLSVLRQPSSYTSNPSLQSTLKNLPFFLY